MAGAEVLAGPAGRGAPTASGRPGVWSPARWFAAFSVGLLALYLLSPALTATHVEGFTASLQLDAIAAQRGLIDRADLLYPVQTEYLYVTRQGVVLMLRGLMAATGGTGDGLFRALTWGSLAVFLLATAWVARRHGRLGWGVTLASLLLLPGLFELGFHFSDGVVAVAFGMTGFALLPPALERRPTLAWLLRAALAGLALGIAALCRADALLLLPLALGLAALDRRRAADWVALCAAALVGLAAAFAVSQAVSGTSLLQALQVGHFFDTLHAGARIVFVRALVCVLFFGLPGLAWVAIGALRTWRSEPTKRRWLLLALPGVVLLYALRSATEVRQIYPYLAPFVVILCARGLQWTVDALRGAEPSTRRRALALVAGSALVWLAPPVFVPVKDGPRAVFGRLWSPPMWRAWQGRVDASLDDVDTLIGQAERLPRLAVVSAHFNTDHYLQLRAWQRGWIPQRVEETADHCGGGVEVWRKGDHALIQIRLDNTYGLSRLDAKDFIAVHLHEALACRSLAGTPAVTSDFWPPLSTEPLSELLRANLPPRPLPAVGFGWPAPAAQWLQQRWGWRSLVVPLLYGVNRSGPLTPQQLALASELAARDWADANSSRRPGGEALPPNMAALAPRFQARYWAVPVSTPAAAAP